MNIKKIGVSGAVILFFMFIILPDIALAGFGITPPYVNNHRLTRGTKFQQKITLVRSNPDEDLNTEITINVPGLDDYISIDRGNRFILPKDVKQLPMLVMVNIPDDADYGEYKGTIRIRTAPIVNSQQAGVSIALGAQVDVDVHIVDKVYDFTVRKVKMADLEVGYRKWGLFFPGKIRFYMTIENTGNVDFGPTKVTLDIYDSQMENLLETVANKNKIKKVKPFEIEEVTAEFPTTLPQGRYTAKYTIYKNDEMASQNTINVSISALGTLSEYKGYGLMALSLSDKLKVGGVLTLFSGLFFVILLFIPRKRKKPRKV